MNRTFLRAPGSSLTGDKKGHMTPVSPEDTRKDHRTQLLQELNLRLKLDSEGPLDEHYEESQNPFNSPSTLSNRIIDIENNSERSDKSEKMKSKLPKKRSVLTKRKGGSTLAGLKQISISRYRPDYTWNRGGRVKELRIRTLGRKFLFIWMENVYGRVRPSAARAHFNKKLLQHVFNDWKEIWWTNVKEWRLMVRAECQHRYVIWSRVFRAWKLFVVHNKAKQNKVLAADNYAQQRTLKRILSGWIQLHKMKREKKRYKDLADNFHHLKLLKTAWASWLHQHQQNQHHQQMETVSLQFWAYRIQTQYWLTWCQKYQERVDERHRLDRAEQLYLKGIKVRCFHNLTAYCRMRKFKQERKGFASKVYYSSLIGRCFNQWCDSLRLRRSLAEHQHKIIRLAQNCLLRKTLLKWKLYIAQKHQRQDKNTVADFHYIRHLLSLGLNGLHLAVVKQKGKVARHQLAEDFRVKQLLRQAWSKWTAQCEEREELELCPLSTIAYRHHRTVVVVKCWKALLTYTANRHSKQELRLKAEAFFYWKSLPKCLFRMKVFVAVMRKKHENQQKSLDFRRENLLARFFYHWFEENERSKDERMSERMAVIHYDGVVGRRFLALWRLKTSQAQELQRKQVVAKEHYEMLLRKRMLMNWKSTVDEIKLLRCNDMKASRHYYVRILKKSLTGWKQFHEQKQTKKRKYLKAKSHFDGKQYKLVLKQWKCHVQQQHDQKAKADKAFQDKCLTLKRCVLQTWYNNVQILIGQKDAETKATNHSQRHLLLKVFKTWHRFAAIHAYKKSETRQLVLEGRDLIHKGILQRTFCRWRSARDDSLMSRLKHEQAAQHNNNNIRLAVLKGWKEFVKLSLKKKLLARQAAWFRQTVLQSRCLLRWKYEHSKSVEIHSKTHLALWHWSVTLQRQVLINWWTYTQTRKQKKNRLAEALERRRSRLLKDGVTQWLKVAQEFNLMRSKFAAQKHTKSAYETFQLAQKYALHWKHIVAKRKVLSQQPSVNLQPEVVKTSNRLEFVPTVSCSPQLPSKTIVRDLPVKFHAEHSDSSPQPIKAARARPRQPEFLIASLKREGLLLSSMEDPSPAEDSHSAKRCSDEKILKFKNSALELTHGNSNQAIVCDNIVDEFGENPANDLPVKSEFQKSSSEFVLEVKRKTGSVDIEGGVAPSSKLDQVVEGDSKAPKSDSRQISSYTDPVKYTKSGQNFKRSVQENTNLTLLAPSTFLTRKDGTPISGLNTPSKNAVINSSNGCLLVQSTPEQRQIQESNRTLSSPRLELKLDHSSDNSPREGLQKENKGSCSAREGSEKWRQAEIIRIRDCLKKFDEKKKKLKELKLQWKHLNDWLQEENVRKDCEEDGQVTRRMREELSQIHNEMLSLKKQINQEKPVCAELVAKVQTLIQQQ